MMFVRIVANYMLMSIVKDYFLYLSKDIRDLNAPLLKVSDLVAL